MKERITQFLIGPNNSTWQGIMFGLSVSGAVYQVNSSGRWEKVVPYLGYGEPSEQGKHETEALKMAQYADILLSTLERIIELNHGMPEDSEEVRIARLAINRPSS